MLALPCLLYSMDLEVLHLALPSLSADLRPSSAQLLWIVDIYGFLLAGSLITMGALGDRIGRRRLLLVGAAAFGAASVLAAYSTSAEMLIAARALLGVAGATLAPSTLSLIRNMFLDPQQRTFAIAVWATCFSVGAAIGPLLGGVMLEFFWWGSVFLIAVPVMALLLVVGPVLLPEFRDPELGHLDLRSAVLSLAAVLAVIYGLKQAAQSGFGAVSAACLVAGTVGGVLFSRRQRRLSEPMIDPRLFQVPAFSASLAINTFSMFAAYGVFFFITQYLQLVVGLSPLRAGLWTIPSAAALVVGSMLAPLLLRWTRPAYVMAGGLALAAAGCALLTQVGRYSGLAMLVTGSVVLLLGVAPVITLATDLLVSAAPPGRAGSASSLSETGVELGGALGIAVLGSIGTAIYRSQLGTGAPDGIAPAAAETARDTLGGAVAEARELPERLGTALLEVARDAFTDGFVLVAGVSGVALAALAVGTVVLIRDVDIDGARRRPPIGPGVRQR